MAHRDSLSMGLPVRLEPHFPVAECNVLDAQLERTMDVVCCVVFDRDGHGTSGTPTFATPGAQSTSYRVGD